MQELRRELVAEAEATIRFETPPGRQLQIDFGSTTVVIAGEPERVFLFVATLGFSRRGFRRAPFGTSARVLGSTASSARSSTSAASRTRCCSTTPRRWSPITTRATREVVFIDRFHAFCRYWGFRPRACAPYRAQTKGKDERGVGYVKANAIAGRDFAILGGVGSASRSHWTREVADRRIHGTIGEAPIERFRRDEAAALRPLPARPPFRSVPRGDAAWSMATAASISTPTTTACPGA